MKKFQLSYTINVVLSVDDIWPDGDAPENPTVADVEKVIDACGGWQRIVSDWNLDDAGGDGEVVECQPLPRPLPREVFP